MNKLKEFFEVVGVQPNEKFRLRDSEGVLDDSVFHFDEFGELRKGTRSHSWFIHRILCGDCEIVPEPFKPKEGCKYWYVNYRGCVRSTNFTGSTADFTNVISGNFFPTDSITEDEYQGIKEKFREAGADVSEWDYES